MYNAISMCENEISKLDNWKSWENSIANLRSPNAEVDFKDLYDYLYLKEIPIPNFEYKRD